MLPWGTHRGFRALTVKPLFSSKDLGYKKFRENEYQKIYLRLSGTWNDLVEAAPLRVPATSTGDISGR